MMILSLKENWRSLFEEFSGNDDLVTPIVVKILNSIVSTIPLRSILKYEA